MSVVILIGRIMLAAIFMGSGVAGHLMAPDQTAAYAQSRGVPSAKILVQISGVLIALGGLGIIFGVFLDVAALGVAIYTLIAAFWVHHFWTDEDPMTQQLEMTQFMKNLAIAGGALILFAFVAANGDRVGFQLTEPLFNIDF